MDGTGPSTVPAGGTEGTGQPTLNLDEILFNPATGLQTVYFDYDSASLRPDALATLSQDADKIKQAPGVLIQLAGHCDERGTQEYNLALGERRALSVRNHLITLGIPASQLVTISYGEEFPAAMGSNEAAWSQNRRVEFNKAQ
ncbi:MAG: peptidoglycan-associated lipoprotein Pal [Candidatus Hydrogenedentes bacterium]|nr:peptidoglycan-associated lipoprotein Pal [Candidatus Hydrogenedentota bacterium]MBI3117729.1 peptidoglycan-associated lipoprotein Pal [Candidatus Hydrogenedentota bacterium]